MSTLGAIVLGGITALVLEWTVFRPRPTQVPLIMSASSSLSPVAALAPYELENKIRINRCHDLYSYICALQNPKDPTGEVRRDSEGEVEVLRLYESIIREKGKVKSSEADAILAEKVYTPARVAVMRTLFEEVKTDLLKFIDAQPFAALGIEDKQLLKDRIADVILELPPPASIYADEPKLLTKTDVFFEKTKSKSRIRIGGALFYSARSRFNLAFTLAHELAHSIDPCELKSQDINILSYQGLAECFGSSLTEYATDCKPSGKLSETFSDWIATHVVANLISRSSVKFTKTQTRTAVYNSVRDLCHDDDRDDDDPAAHEGLSSNHPSSIYRVNSIFAQHPQIRKILGCKEFDGPELPGVPSYCFWPVSKK